MMAEGTVGAPTCSSLTTKMGRCHPNVCTAETGSQLLTATATTGISRNLFFMTFYIYMTCMGFLKYRSIEDLISPTKSQATTRQGCQIIHLSFIH
jgi:hypothetical protein